MANLLYNPRLAVRTPRRYITLAFLSDHHCLLADDHLRRPLCNPTLASPVASRIPVEYTSCNLDLKVPTAEDEQELAQVIPHAAQQSDFILAMGYFAEKAIHQAALQTSSKTFGIVDFEFTPPVPNIASVLFKDDQEGFLAGLLAGEIANGRNKKVAGEYTILAALAGTLRWEFHSEFELTNFIITQSSEESISPTLG